MFWSVAQLLLLSQICLCNRDGTIEESIRTKRVISYLDNPESGHRDFSKYERKKVVETFHHIVKKILPPYPEILNETTDFKALDTKASEHLSELSLKSEDSDDYEETNIRKRRGIELPNSIDFVIENKEGDGDVLSELGRYSIKMMDKDDDQLETTSKASKADVSEPTNGGTDDVYISLQTKVDVNQSQTGDLNRESSTTPSGTDLPITKNYSISELKALKNYLVGKKKQKEARKMSTHSPDIQTSTEKLLSKSNTTSKSSRKSKQRSKPSNKLPKKFVIHIQSKPTENDVKIDMDMLVSLLFPKGPKPVLTREVQSQNNNGNNITDGSSKGLFLWVLGVLSLLGFALLSMTIYLTTIRCMQWKEKSDRSRKKLVLPSPATPPEISSRLPSKSNVSSRRVKSNSTASSPKNLKNLLGKFCEVLGRCQDMPSEMMSQMYGSDQHFDEMKQRVVTKNRSVSE